MEIEMTTGVMFKGVFCEGTGLRLFVTARIPGKHSVNAFDIAWANELSVTLCKAGLSCSGFDAGYVHCYSFIFGGGGSRQFTKHEVCQNIDCRMGHKRQNNWEKNNVMPRTFTKNTRKENWTAIAEKTKTERLEAVKNRSAMPC